MNRSYRLPSGDLIFVFDSQSPDYPPWRIGTVKNNKSEKSIVTFPPFRNVRFITEVDALIALQRYAAANGLEPAY